MYYDKDDNYQTLIKKMVCSEHEKFEKRRTDFRVETIRRTLYEYFTQQTANVIFEVEWVPTSLMKDNFYKIKWLLGGIGGSPQNPSEVVKRGIVEVEVPEIDPSRIPDLSFVALHNGYDGNGPIDDVKLNKIRDFYHSLPDDTATVETPSKENNLENVPVKPPIVFTTEEYSIIKSLAHVYLTENDKSLRVVFNEEVGKHFQHLRFYVVEAVTVIGEGAGEASTVIQIIDNNTLSSRILYLNELLAYDPITESPTVNFSLKDLHYLLRFYNSKNDKKLTINKNSNKLELVV